MFGVKVSVGLDFSALARGHILRWSDVSIFVNSQQIFVQEYRSNFSNVEIT